MATAKTPKTAKKTVTEVVAEVQQAAPEDVKVKKVRAVYNEKAVADSAGLTVEKVTQSLTKAGLDISKTLNSVRELFESEIADLQTIKDAIKAKQEELEQLFDKEIVATSLRELVLLYESRKQALATSEEETRRAWAKESADHAAEVKARNEQLMKERTREQEEYAYNQTIQRRNSEEMWKASLTQKLRDQKETEDKLSKNWEEREELLKKHEAEVAASKAKLDNFDALVKAEVDKQVAIISNSLKKQHETDLKIKTMEFDSAQKFAAHDNDILKATVAAKDKEVQSLRAALEKKDSEVREVAIAAMQSQSGKQALAAVQEAVQNQGKSK